MQEAAVAVRKWRHYGRQMDWAPFVTATTVPAQKSAVMSPAGVAKATMSDRSAACSSAKSASVQAGGDDDGVIMAMCAVMVIR